MGILQEDANLKMEVSSEIFNPAIALQAEGGMAAKNIGSRPIR
jgi:hypothetical protein